MIVQQNSNVLVNGGDLIVSGIPSGSTPLYGPKSLQVSTQSILRVDSGGISITDFPLQTDTQAAITVTGGSFVLDGTATMTSTTTSVTVSGGSFVMDATAAMTSTATSVTVTGNVFNENVSKMGDAHCFKTINRRRSFGED